MELRGKRWIPLLSGLDRLLWERKLEMRRRGRMGFLKEEIIGMLKVEKQLVLFHQTV